MLENGNRVRVLVVDDNPDDVMLVRTILEDAEMDIDIVSAEDGVAALLYLENEEELPGVVLTDLQMPNMNGLELVERIRNAFPFVPVVLMTAFGNEEIAFRSLQKGAASYVPKHNLASGLVETLRQMVDVSRVERQDERLFEYLSSTYSEYSLTNDSLLLSPLIAHLVLDFSRMVESDDNDRLRLSIALDEALTNAIYHGNLEISSNLREDDEASEYYQALVTKRLNMEPYSRRRVFLSARVSHEKGIYVIRDEGPGFDPSTLSDPRDHANLEKVSGRGLFLIRTFMDEAYHNDAGNELTMIKLRTGKSD